MVLLDFTRGKRTMVLRFKFDCQGLKRSYGSRSVDKCLGTLSELTICVVELFLIQEISARLTVCL